MSVKPKTNVILTRDKININDKWKVETLYEDDQFWKSDFDKIDASLVEIEKYKGKVVESKETFLALLSTLSSTGIILERVMQYAFLHHAADGSSSENQRRLSLATQLATRYSSATSFIEPEILTLEKQTFEAWLNQKEFEQYKVMLQKMYRFKNHILSAEQERIMALQSEVASKASDSFSALTNIDFNFGHIVTEDGKIPLTQSTFGSLLQNKDRKVRERSYKKFYRVFDSHKHVLTNLYDASVKQDIFRSKVRSYSDSLAMFLYPDNVDKSVYKNLIAAVHNNFETLHRYYELRRRVLKLDKLDHYDVYVPLVDSIKVHHSYDEAVSLISKAMVPLGKEYVDVLTKGLTEDRWVDRYENKGKRSGAFSSGIYSNHPFILMNYKEDVLRDVFTLAHEGGHAMHSYYSAKNNPYSSYDYTIFEAEVASTFNEQLLAHHMLSSSDNKELRAYILNKQIDDVVATLFRQTMFAEYEMIIHEMVESGEPITVESLRSNYRKLLKAYFGPKVQLFKVSDLEGLRIPHFYRAFYVYKYATGLSAAMTLAEGVLNNEEGAKENYLNFLKSGGSTYPIDSLKKAGVDMSSPKPVEAALKKFENMLTEAETLLL